LSNKSIDIVLFIVMILKLTPEMPEQAHRLGNGSLILNQQSSKQSHYQSDHRSPIMNFQFKI